MCQYPVARRCGEEQELPQFAVVVRFRVCSACRPVSEVNMMPAGCKNSLNTYILLDVTIATTDWAVVCSVKWKDPSALKQVFWVLKGAALLQVVVRLAPFRADRAGASTSSTQLVGIVMHSSCS